MAQEMDLSGVFHIQKQYLTDLSAIAGNNIPVSNYLPSLSTQLNDLYTQFSSANTSSSYVLDHQTKMNTIIQNENNRINTKKMSVDDAIQGQRRLIDLNESYRKKNLQYINILIVFIVTVLLYLGLVLLGRNFPIIPSIVINILIGCVIATAIILIVILMTVINNRDTMDFDKLAFVPPPDVSGNVVSSTGNIDLGSLSLGSCIGSSCCNSGTTWDASSNTCISAPTETAPFTLLSEVYGNNLIITNPAFNTYLPSEYDSYVKM